MLKVNSTTSLQHKGAVQNVYDSLENVYLVVNINVNQNGIYVNCGSWPECTLLRFQSSYN